MINYEKDIFYSLKSADTSYKIFLLKFLLKNIDIAKCRFTFDELSVGMLTEAWPYVIKKGSPFTHSDKLFDIVMEIISQTNITYYSDKNEIINSLQNLEKPTRQKIKQLVAYAPYRLLINEDVSSYLKGTLDRRKNKMIEDISKNYPLFYVINNKEIEVNEGFVKFVERNRRELNLKVEKEISERFFNDLF